MKQEPEASAGQTEEGQLPYGDERRRRPRIQVLQPVRLCGESPKAGRFQEVRTTVNVSTGGIYFTTECAHYRPGMPVTVTFPFTPERAAILKGQPAEVVRIDELPNGLLGIAVKFLAVAEAGESANGNGAHGMKGHARPVVLGVDADAHTLKLYRTTLEAGGYVVRTATSGDEALEQLRQAVPAVMIVGLEIPGISALDLCHIAKRDERFEKTPLVVVTERGALTDYNSARELGAVICMPKPIKADRLLPVIRLLAPVSNSESTLAEQAQARRRGMARGARPAVAAPAVAS